MLRKHEPIAVTQTDPFALDQIGRQDAVENVITLLATVSQPFVLAVDGPWGSGKTTFVDMLGAELSRRGGFRFHFNAWESDFASDPLVAFMAEIDAEVDENDQVRDVAADQWGKAKEIALGGLSLLTPILAKVVTAGVVGKDEVSAVHELATRLGDMKALPLHSSRDPIHDYLSEKRSIQEFKEALQAFVDRVAVAHSGAQYPIIFIVDELDRCRPDFAIRFLERMKHLFSVRGLVFLLALDQCQLAHSIRAVYGSEFDSPGYLRRFIDLTYALPEPSLEKYCDYLFTQFELDEVLRSRADGDSDLAVIKEILTRMAETLEFSLRDVEQCFTQFNIVLRTWPHSAELLERILAFSVPLKLGRRAFYRSYRDGMIGAEELLKELLSSRRGGRLQACLDFGALRAYLFHASKVPGEARREREACEAVVNDETSSSEALAQAEREIVMLDALAKRGRRWLAVPNNNTMLDVVCRRLDISERFGQLGD